MLRCDGILGIGSVRLRDIMECGHAIPWLEFDHIFANLLYDAGDIVAGVAGNVAQFWYFPILRVGSAYHDLFEPFSRSACRCDKRPPKIGIK